MKIFIFSSRGSKLSDNETTKITNTLNQYKIKYKEFVTEINNVSKTLLKDDDLDGVLDINSTSSLHSVLETIYANLPLNAKILKFLIKEDIEIPIKFLIFRQSDLTTTTGYKLLDNGGTFNIEYHYPNTMVTSTNQYHNVQFNFMLGGRFVDPYSLLRFQNISVNAVKGCNLNIYALQNHNGARDIFPHGTINVNSKGSCFILPAKYSTPFAKLDSPLRLNKLRTATVNGKPWSSFINIEGFIATHRFYAALDEGISTLIDQKPSGVNEKTEAKKNYTLGISRTSLL